MHYKNSEYSTFLSSTTYLLPGRTLRSRLLLGLVALIYAAVGVDLEYVGGPGDDAEALEALSGPVLVVGEDDVAAEPAVARAPPGDRVEEDGDGVVGDLPRLDGLGEELALELHREVAAGADWKKKIKHL